MIVGITKEQEKIIKSLLKNYPYEFYYYGSRVKGDYTKSSDLDVLIKGESVIPLLIIEELERRFNESLLPYVVNFSDFNSISEDFYQLIKNDLVRV